MASFTSDYLGSETNSGNSYTQFEPIAQGGNYGAVPINSGDEQPTWPSDTPLYDVSVTSPRGIVSKAYVNLDAGMSWMPEGNNNKKHVSDDTGYVPPPQTDPFLPETPPESPYGLLIAVGLKPGRTGINDAYLTGITFNTSVLDGNQPPEQRGKFFTGDGREFKFSAGGTQSSIIEDDFGNIYTITINDDSTFTLNIDSTSSSIKPVDLAAIGGLCFVPAESYQYSDKDFEIDYTVHFENGRGPKVSQTATNPSLIMVDAVADLPDHISGSELDNVIGASAGGELSISDPDFNDGIITQIITGGMDASGAHSVANLGSYKFKDYEDGSEEHFILVRRDDTSPVQIDFDKLGKGDYAAFVASTETVWVDSNGELGSEDTGAVEYYKILISNQHISSGSGNVNLNIPIFVSGGTSNGDYTLDVRVGAAETVTADDYFLNGDTEIDYGNNFAVTDIQEIHVKVECLDSKVSISTGWVYESGALPSSDDNQNANPGVMQGGQGSARPNGATEDRAAALISIKLDLGDSERLGDWVELRWPTGKGQIYDANGTNITSGTSANVQYASVPSSYFQNGQLNLYFIPEDGNHNYEDFNLEYSFLIHSGSGDSQKTFTADGAIPIVVDAVADPAKVALDASGEAPAHDGFVLDYKPTFKDDPNESHYIIIHNNDHLSLKDISALEPYAVKVDESELHDFENPSPKVGHHFDFKQGDIILRIEDLVSLDMLDGKSDGTIKLPFEVTDRTGAGDKIGVQISTVVVQGGGNNPASWNKPDQDGKIADQEYDLGNNIAVTENTVTVELSSGEMTVGGSRGVYEGDRNEQHLNGDDDSAELGAPITLNFTEPCEVLREISFGLSVADGKPVDGLMAFYLDANTFQAIPEGGRVLFTAQMVGDKAHYTGVQIIDKDGNPVWAHEFDSPVAPEKVHGSDDAFGLRFIPTGDSDLDVTVAISTRIMDARSGDVVTSETPATLIIERDAVADLPREFSATANPDNGHKAFVANDGVNITLTADFRDYEDGSEAHYFFIEKGVLASITAPAGFEVLKEADVSNLWTQVDQHPEFAGLSPENYFAIKVSNDYLGRNNGHVSAVVTGVIAADAAKTDGSDDIVIKAVAVEHQGFLTDKTVGADAEPDNANNVAVVPGKVTINWANLDNEFDFDPDGIAYEDDKPNQHLGSSDTANGTVIRITPHDASEVFDTLTISYKDENGDAAQGIVTLTIGKSEYEIPTGTTLSFTYAKADSNLCTGISYTDSDGIHNISVPNLTLAKLSEGLRYVPRLKDATEDSDFDADVKITFSGTTRETKSGETGTFTAKEITIGVDAVADKPGGDKSEYQYGEDAAGVKFSAIEEGSDISFAINTSFSDFTDGSEKHYLLIDTKYFANGDFTLYDANGKFSGYTPVSGQELAELNANINGSPDISDESSYAVLKIDSSSLGPNGELNLTLKATLLDAAGMLAHGAQKTEMSFGVKAVAVEYDGYATDSADDEDASNNVAISDLDVTFTWDNLGGEFTPEPKAAYEDDQNNQHKGDNSLVGGAALAITPKDDTEIFTSMTITYDESHGKIKFMIGTEELEINSGDSIAFEYGDNSKPTHITKIICGSKSLNVSGLPLAQLTGQNLHYVPNNGDDDDGDIKVTISADTKETTIGATGKWDGEFTIVVDAVADQPKDISSSYTAPGSKDDSIVIVSADKGTDSFDLNLKATFADFTDGSEKHYFFISKDYVSSLDGLPPGLAYAADPNAIIANAGLNGDYIVLEVTQQHLVNNGGIASFALTAHLDNDKLPNEDGKVRVDIKAVAMEHSGVNTPLDGAEISPEHGQDSDAENNVSIVDMDLDIQFARLDNSFDKIEVDAYEGDAPDQHIGNYGAVYGAAINFAPKDSSEVFNTLKVAYDDTHGKLNLHLPLDSGNVTVELPKGAEIAFTYRNSGSGATLCTELAVTVNNTTTTYVLADSTPLSDLLGNGHLTYLPSASSQSDADVSITFTGKATETTTGEQGEFSHTATVRVDAVADQPVVTNASKAENLDGNYASLVPGKEFNISLDVNFGSDVSDGSEAHYFFVSKEFLDALTIPDGMKDILRVLADSDADAVCARVAGPNGIENANSNDWYVLEVDNTWLEKNGSAAKVQLTGQLKGSSALGSETDEHRLDIRAVAVEHEGFLTKTDKDYSSAHGMDVKAENNVSVVDASAPLDFAVVDGEIATVIEAVFEGDEPLQFIDDYDAAHGAHISLAPKDSSEVFTSLTLNYDAGHGSLVLTNSDEPDTPLANGTRLEFVYDPDNPTECVGIKVWQPGDTAPSSVLDYRDQNGRGQSLAILTNSHLKYVPNKGDNDDLDVKVDFTATVLETKTGETKDVDDSFDIVVDAVADMPQDAEITPVVKDSDGNVLREGAYPGETFTVTIEATFNDYTDGSEAHYIFLSKDNWPTNTPLDGFPAYAQPVSVTGELEKIFKALKQDDGEGIHAGLSAIDDYYVLEVSNTYLASEKSNGHIKFDLNIPTSWIGDDGEVKTSPLADYEIEAKAVSIEHQGYATDIEGINDGDDQDVLAENNVAVADMDFVLRVREFNPGKVKVELETEWAFENDRSQGDEKYHTPKDDSDRDNGVRLLFSGQGEGNVISSIVLEYSMPSNGSLTPHRIKSFNADGTLNSDGAPDDDVRITYDTTTKPGTVIVTVTAKDPFAGVGDLHFVPGDNYDNDDVDITVVSVEVADPFLKEVKTGNDDSWGTGVAEDQETLHVKVDAVAQAPEVDDLAVDHDSGNPVLAGDIVKITGKLSYEDLADGSEEHFLLLEMRDGYYPDSILLEYNGNKAPITIRHYDPATGTPANYTLQKLVTPDDNQEHLFIKLPVDAELHELMGGASLERMDDIDLTVDYQTREWAPEGVALHFAAISTEDVEEVREFDPGTLDITNDELPFDEQLKQYVPDLWVMENNTAITIAAQGAYVFWDEYNSDALNFKGFVFENDRPSDHLREPAYVIHRERNGQVYHKEESYPVNDALKPYDPVENTGRDYGTGIELVIPEHTASIKITDATTPPASNGEGDFYFLPKSVWQAYMTSPAPLYDSAIAKYKVDISQSVTAGGADYTLVFIPKHEPYDSSHEENDAHGSHNDLDFWFNYELSVNQLNEKGEVIGVKNYYGEDQVIRVDAVANQAEIVEATTSGPEEFSLWRISGKDTTTKFDLTVSFHDMDETEDHYILVQEVPNFAFRCGSYYYNPAKAGSVASQDADSIYTHVQTGAYGSQKFIRYYKIPVNMADIDPATGNVTVEVEFIRQPGMPAVADYPSSDLLSYGALTEDKTSSRWDSNNPNDPNFINRKGADGEFSYENNTSVIIRNGIDNGADDAGYGPGWWDDSLGGGGGIQIENGYIHWTNGPGSSWSDGYWPTGEKKEGEIGGGTSLDEYWNPGGPAGGGEWWTGQIEGGGEKEETWVPAGGGAWEKLPGGGIGGSRDENWQDNKWIANHDKGLAVEWVFENSTPNGHLELGQYNHIQPTRMYLTGENENAALLELRVPDISSGMIFGINNPVSDWKYQEGAGHHPKATFSIGPDPLNAKPVTPLLRDDGNWVFKIPTSGGELAPGDKLFMIVSPDSMGEDFQLGVTWYDTDGKVIEKDSGQFDVLVDAVAQWANFGFRDEHQDGVYGVTGDAPTQLVDVDLKAFFLDQDGSEGNYVLVERLPGVLPLHKGADGQYEEIREVYLEGKTYLLIEPTKDEQQNNTVHLEFSVNYELTSPMYIEEFEYQNQKFDAMKITLGTMTVEGQTGWGASDSSDPANWEYTLRNNTSLNLKEGALTIAISKVNAEGGNNAIYTQETDAPEDNIVQILPGDNGINLSWDANDILLSLIFTDMAGNGNFFYVDEDGNHHQLPANVDMKDAYLEGRIYHKQNRYDDSDATLSWTAELRDGLSDYSEASVSGTMTVVVDAVAKAEEIHLEFPLHDKIANTLTQTLRFDDYQANEQHYAVVAPDIYRAIGDRANILDQSGNVLATVNVETIFSPDGKPYYAVRLDGYLDASGAATVQFSMRELNVKNIEKFPVISGGVSIEPNSGYFADDREPDLENNWAINTRVDFPSQGNVSTTGLAFVAPQIVECNKNGAPITLDGTLGDNDIIAGATLTFSQATRMAGLFDGNAGDQVATIVYDGQCHAVTLDGSGNATVTLDFGASGFDNSADFRIIWGTARMDAGALVVDGWNHNANGSLNFTTDFTIKNQLSGQTASVNGSDPDGIDLVPTATAGENIAGQITAINGNPVTGPVGAGADVVTITLTGEFADTDGSETHYLLLELPSGWTTVSHGSSTVRKFGNVNYLCVEVDATDANPSCEVSLTTPAGIKGNTQLKTAALVIEGNGGDGNEVFSQGAAVGVDISGINATGVSAQAINTVEDVPVSLASLASAQLLGGDSNDVLQSVVFTELGDGSLVDGDGNELGKTITVDMLSSGNVFYRPMANYAGETNGLGRPLPVSLTFDAVIGETNTGATTTLKNQSLSINITPDADAPINVGGVSDNSDLGNVQTGHRAQISVTLNAEFADVDGSEAHFFIVSTPAGVRVISGDGYTVSSLTVSELAELDSIDPSFAASGSLFKIQLPASESASVSLPINLDVVTTVYNGGQLLVAGAASEMLADGSHDYGISIGSPVNLPPRVGPEFGNQSPDPEASSLTIDSLREMNVSGTLNMKVDPDDDDLVVSGVSFGDVQGSQITLEGKTCFGVQGQYGTLYVFEDGSYRYERDAAIYDVEAQEVFTYYLADAYGGKGENTITIDLATPNTAPVATPASSRLDSVRNNVTEGALSFSDKDGDSVSVVAVKGNSGMVNIGTADNPLMAFEAAGDYGIIHVFEDNGQWKYRYTRSDDHRGETGAESFSFTLSDEHGLTSDGSIAIELYNANSNPVADKVTDNMDTLRDADGIVSGSASLRDADNDYVSLTSASGFGGEGEWGQDENGNAAYVIFGQHGTIYLYQNDGTEIQYRYVLTNKNAQGVNATESFTYNVDDGYLGAASGTITINLSNTNNEPQISGTLRAEIDSLRADQASGTLVFSDPDYNADAGRNDLVKLSATSFNGTAGVSDGNGGFTVAGVYGIFHISANGAYTYKMHSGSHGKDGQDAFIVTVTDEFGKSHSETVSIDLISHNENPTAFAGQLSLNTWRDGGKAVGSVEMSDADDDPVSVASLTGIVPGVWGVDDEGQRALVAQGEHGILYLREDGSYRYILADDAAGVSGSETFSCTVSDPYGGIGETTIVINLNNANADPVITGQLASSIGGNIDNYENGIVRETGTFAWSDIDGDAIASISVGGTELPSSGEITVEGKYGTLIVATDGNASATYTYTMKEGLDKEGLRDVDSFNIVVTDEFGGTTTESLVITLSPLSHKPECDDVNYNWPKTHTGSPASFLSGNLSFRDADMKYDETETLHLAVEGVAVEGETIQIQGKYGILDIAADGTFTYRVPEHLGEDLLESFTYVVTDAAGNHAEACLYIRLGDNSSPFPNTGTTEEGIVPAGSGIDPAIFADFNFLSGTGSAPSTGIDHGGNNISAPIEVSDVGLVNVPLPYDQAEASLNS